MGITCVCSWRFPAVCKPPHAHAVGGFLQDGTRQFARLAVAPGLVLEALHQGPNTIKVHLDMDPEFAGAFLCFLFCLLCLFFCVFVIAFFISVLCSCFKKVRLVVSKRRGLRSLILVEYER